MQKIWDITISMYEKYTGDSWQMILLAAALLYLCITLKRRKEQLSFVLISLLFGFVFLCPVTAKIIMKYCIGKSVYWRMLWILPRVCIIAYAGTCVLSDVKKRGIRAAVLLVLCVLIGISGSCIYGKENYSKADNIYKLPAPTVEVCEMISKDAEEQQIGQVKVLVPNPLVCYIRQYDASFLTPYGRNVFKYENLTQNQAGLFSQMSSDEAEPETLNMLLRNEGCNYFVWDRQDETREAFEDFDFVPVGDVQGYRVFRIE